jgi:hypothetical protein
MISRTASTTLTVDVCYLPTDPTVSRLCGADTTPFALDNDRLALVVSGLLFVLSVIGIVVMAVKLFRWLFHRRGSKLVYGEVVDCQFTPDGQFTVRYCFQTLDGLTQEDTVNGNKRSVGLFEKNTLTGTYSSVKKAYFGNADLRPPLPKTVALWAMNQGQYQIL